MMSVYKIANTKMRRTADLCYTGSLISNIEAETKMAAIFQTTLSNFLE